MAELKTYVIRRRDAWKTPEELQEAGAKSAQVGEPLEIGVAPRAGGHDVLAHPCERRLAPRSRRPGISTGCHAEQPNQIAAAADRTRMALDTTPAAQHRLVTRSDFDGLVCAALLKELGLLDDILFVHPKDMQDGKIEVGPGDITTNLPYVPGVGLAFDHHASEAIRVEESPDNHIIMPDAMSAARVVYDYYGGAERFPTISEEMMDAVDKADAAQFSESEILDPQGWILMSFLMDPRTGLGRFREFRISNYQLMMQLIDDCTQLTVEEILATPDVAERVELYHDHSERAAEQIRRCAQVEGNLVVLDLRDEEVIHPTNRFMIYALYPDTNISIHVLWGLKQQNTVFATGKSIINRSSRTNVGELMLAHGGGGHDAAGTCQVANVAAGLVLEELAATITADG
jgi:nanoRNase/pAp phosphatase (c-di-AMP/oligoRNAs hydrolase)